MTNTEQQSRTFEASLEALEQIVRELEQGDLALEKVSSYSSKAFVFRESARSDSVKQSGASKYCCVITRDAPWWPPLKISTLPRKALENENIF